MNYKVNGKRFVLSSQPSCYRPELLLCKSSLLGLGSLTEGELYSIKAEIRFTALHSGRFGFTKEKVVYPTALKTPKVKKLLTSERESDVS